MNTSHQNTDKQVRAVEAQFDAGNLLVTLSDGRVISLPMDRIDWLTWLAKATPEQKRKWAIEPGGYAIYWEDLDDGVEVCHLLDTVAMA